jgi:hypothetical protein
MTRLEALVTEIAGKPPDKLPTQLPFASPAPTPTPPQPITVPPAPQKPQPASSPVSITQTPSEPSQELPEPSPKSQFLDKPTAALPDETWRDSLPENIWRGDFWFNKIGLGLLLLALAFLFNYAIDQGWIGPAVRVAFGLILGTTLLGIGYKTSQKRPNFGQALQGGGIVAYYITGFAAFRLYSLVSFPVAFGFMLLVTLLAFTLSLRQKEAIFSLIGGLGGLATPFLLNTGQGNYVGLIIYTCLICGSLVLIYFFKGWRVLLWLANFGDWIILAGVLFFASLETSQVINAENIILQVGILFGLFFFWGMPVLRQLETAKRPDRLPPVQFGIFDGALARARLSLKDTPRLTMIINPLIALGLTQTLWWLPETNQGLIALGGTLLFALVAVWIATKPNQDKLWYVHGFTAVLLFTIALLQLLDGKWLFLALSLEAIALHVSTRYLKYTSLEVIAHLLSLAVTVMLFDRLLIRFTPDQQTPIFNLSSLLELLIVGLWFALVNFLQTKKKSRLQPIYWLTAHLALILWCQRELPQFNQPGFVTAGFGLLAIFFHWDAHRQEHDWQRWIPHLLSLVITFMLFNQLWFWRTTTEVFNLLTFFNLTIIGLVFITPYLFTEQEISIFQPGYWLITYVALLLWWQRVLEPFDMPGLVTVSWGMLAIVFHWDARRQVHIWQSWVPHLLSVVITFMLFNQLWYGRAETAVFNQLAFFNLIIIGLLFASSYLFTEDKDIEVRLIYRLVCHIALLNWFWREFDQLSGQGIVTLVWGIYALILLAISLRYQSYQLRLVALATLFLLVGKLFLVDLAAVETVWRILLFAGFGGLFLFISYYYRSWLHLPEHAD